MQQSMESELMMSRLLNERLAFYLQEYLGIVNSIRKGVLFLLDLSPVLLAKPIFSWLCNQSRKLYM